MVIFTAVFLSGIRCYCGPEDFQKVGDPDEVVVIGGLSDPRVDREDVGIGVGVGQKFSPAVYVIGLFIRDVLVDGQHHAVVVRGDAEGVGGLDSTRLGDRQGAARIAIGGFTETCISLV